MGNIILKKYRYNELLLEIDQQSIEIILDRDTDPANKTLKEYGFDTKRYFITVNISVTENGYLSPGDYDTPDEYNVESTEINIELVSIHLGEQNIQIGSEYMDGLVDAVKNILMIC